MWHEAWHLDVYLPPPVYVWKYFYNFFQDNAKCMQIQGLSEFLVEKKAPKQHSSYYTWAPPLFMATAAYKKVCPITCWVHTGSVFSEVEEYFLLQLC